MLGVSTCGHQMEQGAEEDREAQLRGEDLGSSSTAALPCEELCHGPGKTISGLN